MPEPQPTPRLRAVDVTSGHGVVAAKIVDGTIEANRAAVILDTVRDAISRYDEDLKFVVLDCGDVGFINSSGVAVFLELANEVRAKGADPIIFRPTDNVAEILRMVKADRVYRFVRTVDELANVLGEDNHG